jgi:hypothetical protein
MYSLFNHTSGISRIEWVGIQHTFVQSLISPSCQASRFHAAPGSRDPPPSYSSTSSLGLYVPPLASIASITSIGGLPVTRAAYSPRAFLSTHQHPFHVFHSGSKQGHTDSLPFRNPRFIRFEHRNHSIEIYTRTFSHSLRLSPHLHISSDTRLSRHRVAMWWTDLEDIFAVWTTVFYEFGQGAND